ncbi:hypothetical protein TeGR_g12015, partial [Tetraparma gracilis]
MKVSVTLSTKEIMDLVQGSTNQRRRVIEARVGPIDTGTFVSLVNMTTQGPSAPALAAVDAAPAPAAAAAAAAPAAAAAAAPAAAAAAAPADDAADDDDNHLADSASNVAGQQAQEAMKAASVTLCSSAWSSRKEAVTAVRTNATRQGAKLQQLLYKWDPDGKKINVGGGAPPSWESLCHSVDTCSAPPSATTREVRASAGGLMATANYAMTGEGLGQHLQQKQLPTQKDTRWRAQRGARDEAAGNYDTAFEHLERYGKEYMRLNVGSHAWTTKDNDGNFESFFISFKPEADIMRKAGFSSFAIDGTHSRHTRYAGTYLVLTGKDAEHHVHILAILVCDSESSASYEEFAQALKKAGMGDLFESPGEEGKSAFQREGEPAGVFGDRDKGMGAFFKEFPDAFHLFCTWHLINNVFDPRAGKARRSPAIEKLIWGLQASESKEEFEKKLTGLAAESRNAADYLGNLPPEKWVAYAMAEAYGVFAHGVKTNQQVESQNGSISEARCHAPLQCIHLIVNIISQRMVRWTKAAKKMAETDGMLVPKMKELVYLQTSRLLEYSVDVVLIGRKATVRKGGRMDSENKIDITTEKAQPCLCGFMAAHNIGCRHFFAWRTKEPDWTNLSDYFEKDAPTYMLKASYVDAFSGDGAAVVPPDLGAIVGQEITIDDPPTYVLKPKREKDHKKNQKKRFQSKGGKAGDGAKPPKRQVASSIKDIDENGEEMFMGLEGVHPNSAATIASAASAKSASGRARRKDTRRAGVRCTYLRHIKEWPTADLTCVQCQRSVCIRCVRQNVKWAAGTSDICGEFPNCKASGQAAAAAHPV